MSIVLMSVSLLTLYMNSYANITNDIACTAKAATKCKRQNPT